MIRYFESAKCDHVMLLSTENLHWKRSPGEQKDDRLWAMVSLAAFALLSLLWAFMVDAPWDDDCPTRFFNTQNAFNDPVNFISVWNRPLFVVLFALPAQLGKWVVPIGMTLISTLGAWLLWRSVHQLKAPNAWLSIPFLAFQPFFYGTSRAALTEPLAVVVICAGFYFLVHKKWLWYALMGGLLPLARLELSIALILWIWPLLREKQWKHLPWLVLPMVLWNLAAGFMVGDFNYVYHNTFGADAGENRYGNTGFSHYFRRSMWVTGPVVFVFLLQGVVQRAVQKKTSLWIEGQLLLGLLVYVIFSWKMSMGNAAGFLRNLVPLTPLAALLALEGYNHSIATLLKFDPKRTTRKRDLLILASVVALCLFLGWQFFAVELRMHQIVGPAREYSRLVVLGGMVAGALWLFWKSGSSRQLAAIHVGYAAKVLAAGTMVYALYQEPPSASTNFERQGLSIVTDYYAQSKFRDRPTYVNHNWFFWVLGERPSDPKFDRVTMKNLEAAPVGSIIVWDVHYATRLAGDVSQQYLVDHLEYVELLRIGVANRGESVILLEKSSRDSSQQEQVSQTFAKENPSFLPAITARGFRLLSVKRFQEAVDLFDFALHRVDNDPDLWFGRGYGMLNLGRMIEAAGSLNNAVMIAGNFQVAWYNLGRAHAAMQEYKNALWAFDQALALDPKSVEVWHASAMTKVAMGDLDGAIGDFTQALALYPRNLGALINRAGAYSIQGNTARAMADISAAERLKPGDLEIAFMKGRILYQSGQKDVGCAQMRQAVAAGYAEAAKYLAKTCDAAYSQDSIQALPK